MARCLLALGSNLGDRQAILADACAAVASLPSCHLLARSQWYGTAPIGGAEGQGDFLNGALLIETSLDTHALANALQGIEAQLGRQRVERWDARTLDIDVLLYGEQVIETPQLSVPHPRMSFRSFVLEPAAEIAGSMLHPTIGWTIARLKTHLQSSPRCVIVTAAEDVLADWLTSRLSSSFCCKQADFSQLAEQLELPAGDSQEPPVILQLPAAELGEFAKSMVSQPGFVRPAVTIALDVEEPQNLRRVAQVSGFDAETEVPQNQFSQWLQQPGVGPLARMTVDDEALVLQEAHAALRSIWPDLEEVHSTTYIEK